MLPCSSAAAVYARYQRGRMHFVDGPRCRSSERVSEGQVWAAGAGIEPFIQARQILRWDGGSYQLRLMCSVAIEYRGCILGGSVNIQSNYDALARLERASASVQRPA